MLASPSDLFSYLDDQGIAHHTVAHAATFTVEEGRHLKAQMSGGHTKNLFMKDKTGQHVLISAWAESKLQLNQLHKLIGTKRLSFASAAAMQAHLGVVPGSVTAFALVNDPQAHVRFILDTALTQFEVVNFHPLVNTATTRISLDDLRRFVTSTHHTLEEVDFADLSRA